MRTFSWRTVAAYSLWALLLPGLPLRAGHAITISLVDRSTAEPVTYRNQLLLAPEGFILDTTALQGRASSFLCRRNDALYLLDHAARRYSPVNLQLLSGASGLARHAERLLGGSTADADASQAVTVQRTDRERDMAGLPCRLYHVKRGGVTIQEIWTTPWSAVTLPEQDFALIRQVAGSWTTIAPLLRTSGQAMPDIPLDGLLAVEGYPVLFRQLVKGQAVYEGRFGTPKAAPTPPTAFNVPPAYTLSAPRTSP